MSSLQFGVKQQKMPLTCALGEVLGKWMLFVDDPLDKEPPVFDASSSSLRANAISKPRSSGCRILKDSIAYVPVTAQNPGFLKEQRSIPPSMLDLEYMQWKAMVHLS